MTSVFGQSPESVTAKVVHQNIKYVGGTRLIFKGFFTNNPENFMIRCRSALPWDYCSSPPQLQNEAL